MEIVAFLGFPHLMWNVRQTELQTFCQNTAGLPRRILVSIRTSHLLQQLQCFAYSSIVQNTLQIIECVDSESKGDIQKEYWKCNVGQKHCNSAKKSNVYIFFFMYYIYINYTHTHIYGCSDWQYCLYCFLTQLLQKFCAKFLSNSFFLFCTLF